MTISVSKNMLLAKLQQLSRIIPSKSTTPIVCNYLFEIKDGRLFITTANDEGRITASLECMAEEDLSICVPASILDGLKTLPEFISIRTINRFLLNIMEVNSRSSDMIRSLSRKRKRQRFLTKSGLRRKNSITVSPK